MEQDAPQRLAGLMVAIDVQHLWKPPPHQRDQGSDYRLADGRHIAEAEGSLLYAAAAGLWLAARGAQVLRNDPTRGILLGAYADRNRAALAWGAQVYLACHINAGGGRYGLVEWLDGNPGEPLSNGITAELKLIPEIGEAHGRKLTPQERGVACVRACGARIAAVIVEPFFGDTPAMQALLAPQRLVQVGEAVGRGVAAWWERLRNRAAVL